MIRQICHDIKVERANEVEVIFLAACGRYGIIQKEDKASFLAQICHESGEFTIKSENMNYTTPERIVDIWPTRFNLSGGDGKLNAHEYTHNPEKLANEVYKERMGNGAPASGDGFKYRGGGFLQLTGREAYGKYARYINKEIGYVADVIRTNDDMAMDAAAWEYAVDKKLLGVTDFEVITRRINGGLIGFGERKKYLALALQFITVLFFIFCSVTSIAQQQAIKYPGYTAYWNPVTLIPDSVKYVATAHTKDAEREAVFHATGGRLNEDRDYRGSGYDQGHLCNASDENGNKVDEYNSFDQCNIYPQRPNCNRLTWLAIENYVRAVAVKYGPVVVKVSWHGTIGHIGADKVTVPLYCDKEIWYNGGHELYEVPNQDTVNRHPFWYYKINKF